MLKSIFVKSAIIASSILLLSGCAQAEKKPMVLMSPTQFVEIVSSYSKISDIGDKGFSVGSSLYWNPGDTKLNSTQGQYSVLVKKLESGTSEFCYQDSLGVGSYLIETSNTSVTTKYDISPNVCENFSSGVQIEATPNGETRFDLTVKSITKGAVADSFTQALQNFFNTAKADSPQTSPGM